MSIKIEIKAKIYNYHSVLSSVVKLPFKNFVLALSNDKKSLLQFNDFTVTIKSSNHITINGTCSLEEMKKSFISSDDANTSSLIDDFFLHIDRIDMLLFDGLNLVLEIISIKFYISGHIYSIPSEVLFNYNNSHVYNQLLDTTLKGVIYDSSNKRFLQYQLLLKYPLNKQTIQIFDNSLTLINEISTNFEVDKEALSYLDSYLFINHCSLVKGLVASIFADKSDTNFSENCICSHYKSLYLISDRFDTGVFISDIRKTVSLEKFGDFYYCRPLLYSDRNLVRGDCFLFSSEFHFKQLSKYPLPIYDKLE